MNGETTAVRSERPVAASESPASQRLLFGLPWYVVGLLVLSVLIRLGFWAYTHRVWEDALITLAAVRNAFTPIGFTHHAGEGRVYSYTSGLSVLIPLAGEALSRGSGLLALRLASLVAAPFAVLFTWLICRRLGIGTWPTVLAMTYVAADHEEVFFGMAGMETQVATTILLGGIYAVMREDDLWIGISFGLALLARPDFALWVLPAAIYIARSRGWAPVLRAILVGALVYGPWFLFTWAYYGTPIPETIQAKAVVFSPIRLILGSGHLGPLDWLGNALHLYGTEFGMFSPFYETGSIDAAPLPLAAGLVVSLFIAVLAVQGAARVRRLPGAQPLVVYAGLFLVYLVLFLGAGAFGWYMPPFRAIVVILAAAGMMRLRQAFPRFAPAFAGVLAALFAVSSVMLFAIDAKIQTLEDSVRIRVGQYLGDHGPGQTVVTESSGYIGYYSHSHLYDFPGLTSPTAYHTLAAAPPQDRSLVYLVFKLHPDWVVFRPQEYTYFKTRYPDVASEYTVAVRYRSDEPLTALGITVDTIDREFLVLKRS